MGKFVVVKEKGDGLKNHDGSLSNIFHLLI